MDGARASGATLAEVMASDEAILLRGTPAVRVRVIGETGVSFGVGTPRNGAAERRAQGLGLPTVRRSTGGTGILHLPGDLAWSIVLPRSDPRVGPDFSSAYGRLGAGLVLFLAELGLEGQWSEPEGLSEEFCLLGRRGRALTVDGRVLGGAAQHVTQQALLHHGVVARSLDLPLVERVFGLPPAVAGARLTSLAALGVAADPAELAETLARVLGATTGAGGRS